MTKLSDRRRPLRSGFTLVEMLVVLAILVLLVGMVAPRVLKSQKKADVNNARAQLGMFRTCLERYAVDLKDFPTTEQGLRALVAPPDSAGTAADIGGDTLSDPGSFSDSGSGISSGGGGSAAAWDGPYVNQETIPKDPWGNEYQYEYPPTHGSGDYPDIWSYGPDGEDGTEDDIVSWSSTDGDSSDPTMGDETGSSASRSSEPSASFD